MHYTCDQCYKLKGPSYRECQADQQWTDTLPTCERKYGKECVVSRRSVEGGGRGRLVSTSPRMQDVAVFGWGEMPPGR